MNMPISPLPALAAVGRRLGIGRSKTDAILLLEADHRTVEELFARFEKAKSSRDKNSIFARIAKELKIHMELEEKIFYPAARKVLEDDVMVDEGVVEHQHAKELLRTVEGMEPIDDMYDGEMKVLIDYVKHHVKEEEREMFPALRSQGMDVEAVGAKLAARKKLIKQRMSSNGHTRGAKKTAPAKRKSAKRTAKKPASKSRR